MLPGKAVSPMNDAAFMTTMRWAVWDQLQTLGVPIHMTFGYITARQRKHFGIEKSHRNDARCISGFGGAAPVDEWFAIKKVRCHNRQIHKQKILHGGIRKRNQAPYEVFGFRLGDKVLCKGKTGFIHGRRSSGSFDIRTLGGDVISHSISYKKLKLLEPTHNVLIERRKAFPPTTEVMGFHA